MKFKKYLAIATLGTLIVTSMPAASAGLDDVFKQANQKNSEIEAQLRLNREAEQNAYANEQKKEGIGIPPYSLKEMGILLSFFMLGQPTEFLWHMSLIRDVSTKENYPQINGSTWFNENEGAKNLVKKRIGVNSFEIGRARAFGIQSFGGRSDCRGYYNPFLSGNTGSEVLAHTLNYINHSASNNTEGMANSALYIKRLLDKRAPGCSSEDNATLNGNLKSFIDMLIKSKDTLISQRNSIFNEANELIIEQNKIEKANLEKLEEERKSRSAENDLASERARKAKEELERPNRECIASNKYKVYKASERISQVNSELIRQKSIMDRERKAASISGYENKDLMYQTGKSILYWQDEQNRAYQAYKSFGGTASSASIIKAPDENPCARP